MKEYDDYRATMKLNQEKSLLPETLMLLRQRRDAVVIREVAGKLNSMSNYLYSDIRRSIVGFNEDRIDQLVNELTRMKNSITNFKTEFIVQENDSVEKKRIIYNKPCVYKDCRGFTNVVGKCGICSKWICIECNQPKKGKCDLEHVCKKEDIETVKLLNQCKPCPNCKEFIYKQDGCPKMWCTNCHKGFDWNTLQVEVVTHNPHLIEWKARQEQTDNEGSSSHNNNNNNIEEVTNRTNNINPATFQAAIKKRFITSHAKEIRDKINFANNVIQFIYHLRDYVMPQMIRDSESLFLDLRIKYLKSHITEADWKSKIKNETKRVELNRSILFIYDMFVTSSIETINNFIYADLNSEIYNFNDLEKRISDLFSEVNKQLNQIGKNFALSVNKYTITNFRIKIHST
jgi:hypothetical protein